VNAPFNITNERIQNDERDVRWDITATLLIMYGMRLLSLVWLPLLPKQKEATQYLKATGGTNTFAGYVTAFYVLFAMAWSVVTNILSIVPTTSCLAIAGGTGCDS